MQHFIPYSKQHIISLTKNRRFETKLGEKIEAFADNVKTVEEGIANSKSKYIVFGIPEDMGVKANGGTGGADTVWYSFLHSFLNIQSNDFLGGENILVAGHFDFREIARVIEENATNEEEKTEAYRHAVTMVDNAVESLIKLITQYNKIPVVIGGGHNNAYPCIKGAAKGLHKAGVLPIAQINVINLDAHSDYRPLEGRHSGNAFRYAEEDGYMEKYCIVGLHENYIPQNVWLDILNNPFIDCVTYEDIFIHEKRSFIQAVAHATGFVDNSYCGIEVDLDSIENVLSSAATPSGISALQARQFIHFAAVDTKPAYLHICEGASKLSNGSESRLTGKLISYLVGDFIKASSII